MIKKNIEIWADSFHEGDWCCENIATIANKAGYTTSKTFIRGLQPEYTLTKGDYEIVLTVFGSYRSWSPIPEKIKELIDWGKPDFIAYDANSDNILFAVEETAATPTGNQAMQRCERQYGSSRFKIPYWYLISEYGMHHDGGVRRDSIWPTIAAIKLSIINKTPCLVLHYSDIDNPEDYGSGSGVHLLFSSLFSILQNHAQAKDRLSGMESLLESQYAEMLSFVQSQWKNIIDFLPSESAINDKQTAKILAEISTGDSSHSNSINELLSWPKINDVPISVRNKWTKKPLLKYDPLCAKMEQDIEDGKAYYLSDNAGSGKPPTAQQLSGWIKQQEALFKRGDALTPPASFSMQLADFPDTGNGNGRRHLTTAKNIVYLYDSWNTFVESVYYAYPRLKNKFKKLEEDKPVFVYVSNSIKPGRLFGDPFTGQLAAYSTAFGKFDSNKRMVVAYFPHQVHTQAIHGSSVASNKGMTLMGELTDYIIFHSGVAISLQNKEVL